MINMRSLEDQRIYPSQINGAGITNNATTYGDVKYGYQMASDLYAAKKRHY
ncbi:hypothetical protein SLEP1_g46012 [Rubroshorea leprosula]|uniref:Uncharacterized protein n=1 Tax=Rubroshorea leprosula TaxID=152421 RepID=A0AAV5LKV2_9ROSI|nr:hypothetical protein SLEP1_g46012 [Rubroshorea leprosula]